MNAAVGTKEVQSVDTDAQTVAFPRVEGFGNLMDGGKIAKLGRWDGLAVGDEECGNFFFGFLITYDGQNHIS